MPGNKRKLRSKKNPLLFDDDDAGAEIVTHEDIQIVDKLGRTKTKRIKVPLTTPADPGTLSHSQARDNFGLYPNEGPNIYEDDNDLLTSRLPTKKKVSLWQLYMIKYVTIDTLVTLVQNQTDYLKDFVDRIDELLEASLCHDARNLQRQRCGYCEDGKWAAWRCVDCILGHPACRRCMRNNHKSNPLHRIKRWTGNHYRPAELWEVGTYLIVPHREGNNTCEVLNFEQEVLEHFEAGNDEVDQGQMEQTRVVPGHDSAYEMGHQIDEEEEYENIDNTPIMQPYLPPLPTTSGAGTPLIPNTDALNNSYVRIVHTNGIHNLALVTCNCQRSQTVPLDLVACRFMPASFTNIRTLFSAEVLDYSHLCNLELKSSAYQFSQLLRRLTLPGAPADVANLYNEFRRMSRLWRWIKRLQSAGYTHQDKSPQQVSTGDLANFCPACPQPGINLPEAWQHDPNKFVYRRVFVADGNFKADHVRQKNNMDIWLSEGGGMMPRQDEYAAFLQQAFEISTVSNSFIAGNHADP